MFGWIVRHFLLHFLLFGSLFSFNDDFFCFINQILTVRKTNFHNLNYYFLNHPLHPFFIITIKALCFIMNLFMNQSIFFNWKYFYVTLNLNYPNLNHSCSKKFLSSSFWSCLAFIFYEFFVHFILYLNLIWTSN